MVRISIGENEGGQRLDRFLRKYLANAPLSLIYRFIRKDVKVNGKRRSEDHMLRAGDEVDLYLPEEELEKMRRVNKAPSARKKFRVAYEDENILIAEKPAGLLTHGDATEKKEHLTNQVISYLAQNGEYDPQENLTFVPAPANRLDRNTSGLVCFGKNAEAQRDLADMFANHHRIRKFYRAIVAGQVTGPMELTGRMTKDEDSNTSGISEEGKEMLTLVSPIRVSEEASVVRLEIRTGRTHQIRLQLSDAGHPVMGDPKYGDPRANKVLKEKYRITTQLLHAEELEFCDQNGILGYMGGKTVTADLPRRFAEVERNI